MAKVIRIIPYIITPLMLVILPLILPSYLQSLLVKVLIFTIFAMSLDILFGYTGLFSLGHAAYLGMAGYSTAILIGRFGIDNFWITMPISLLVAGFTAAIFGIIALRLSGLYFLIITFSLGQLLSSIAMKWYRVTGGYYGLTGIPLPNLGIHGFSWTTMSFYYFSFAICLLCFVLLSKLVRSPFGHVLQGIRENKLRMDALGYNSRLYQYTAFIISGLFAGLSGILLAHFNGIVVPDYLGFQTSGLVMFMVIIGGAGTLYGALIGSAIILVIQFVASLFTPERWPLILGSAFVLIVLYFRGGLSIHITRAYQNIAGKIWKL